MINDPISKALNMVPMQGVLPVESKPIDNNDDFEYARGNMLSILERGNGALDSLLDVADQSQHPRAYEVVATLIKTLADANKDLLELQKKNKELKKVEDNNTPKTINNNLFVGSTTELQRLLKKHDQE